MKKPILVEQYADNGEFSHWHLIEPEDGGVLWSSFPEETKAQGQKIISSKPLVSGSLPPDYHFSNEHGKEVTVLTIKGEWCMVSEEGKKTPYVLPLEFIMAIKEGGNDH